MTQQQQYPGVLERIKAMIADTVVMVVFMAIISYIFSLFENVPDNLRIAAFVFIFVLYDPLFTSIFGGTLGHMVMGIRVARESNDTKNIIFPLACLRFVVKALLGWASLLTVLSNNKRRAIHDFLIGSVVIKA